jgi:hypothetical protein
MPLRRDPEAVVTAHILDPQRRELFVEGQRDRVFLLWLVGSDRLPNARVAEIDEVNLPGVGEGGRRARLLAFAGMLVGEPADIRFMADADRARLTAEAVPGNVWLTDLRDLEGYVFQPMCVEKALMLGANVAGIDADALVENIGRLGRRLAALRSLSVQEELRLPFQELDLYRYVSVNAAGVEVDHERVLRVLMQNAGISLSRFDELIEAWLREEGALEEVPVEQLVHGKDTMCLLGEFLGLYGVSRADAQKVVWASFERRLLDQYPVLQQVVSYLTAA